MVEPRGACARAGAADQFTIDPTPDSFGAVVTDTADNGYVAWEHVGTGGVADQPMFCKLAPAASRCAHPFSLSLPGAGAGAQSNALQLFPILGPGSTVWVCRAPLRARRHAGLDLQPAPLGVTASLAGAPNA
jgi:hypothetical protein